MMLKDTSSTAPVLKALPLDGGGLGGGDGPGAWALHVKNYPIGGAYERARALRREMTQAETKLWRMLRSRQIEGYRFRRQVPLGRYIADFVVTKPRLIVELDGGQHDSLSQQEADRSRFLQREGYRGHTLLE